MAKHSRNRQSAAKKWNRDIPDSVLLVNSTVNTLQRSESLCPSLATMARFVAGVPEAQAIITAYAPLPLPVTEVRL